MMCRIDRRSLRDRQGYRRSIFGIEVFRVLSVIDKSLGGRSGYGSQSGHESGQGKGKSRNIQHGVRGLGDALRHRLAVEMP